MTAACITARATNEPRPSETALAARVAAMADACTRCGKCVEVCPVTGPGDVHAEPRAVIAGIIDILRTGEGPQAVAQMGERLRAQRRMHQGLRLRRQSALPARHGAPGHDAKAGRRRASSAGRASKASARSRATSPTSRASSSTTKLLARLGQKADSRSEARHARRISSSTPAATCSRRRTLRCWRSTSWTRSASPIR